MRRGMAIGGGALVLALSACGGGGGGVETTPAPPVAVVPAPVPAPSPTATPPVVADADSAEYRATVGAVSMNALAAYNRGATGAGVAIGIVDTGIDLQSEEFGSRISTSSAAVAGNASIDDEGGHGTAVAFTAAGRRNGAGTHGVAFDATLVVLRADRPGSCTETPTEDSDSPCRIPTDAITRGVDAARVAGARVVNISLGGSEMPASLRAAIGRATAAGTIVVIAAGNDGTADPDAFTAVANDPAVARGLVIIAGSIGAGDAISSFSDRAGTSAAAFLAAVGERVRAPDAAGVPRLWSGTSFAAPQIAGAIALLAQAFPNLSGTQIVELLYRTARDLGAPGLDPIYGRGALDLTRAFQPVGTTSLAGTGAGVSLLANATLSAPMGDARQAGLGAVILDGYARAFAIDLAGTVRPAAPNRALLFGLAGAGRTVAGARGDTTLAMSLAATSGGGARLDRLGLSRADADAAAVIAAVATQRLGGVTLGLAVAQGGEALAARLAGRGAPAFLVAPAGGLGFEARATGAGAVRAVLGGAGLTAVAEQGRVWTPRIGPLAGADAFNRSRYASAGLAIDRRFGALSASAGLTRLDEADTMLGARFGPGLGATRAASWFVDAGLRVDLPGGWSAGGGARRGWTRASLRGGLVGGGQVRTAAFAADLGKRGLFGGDRIDVRIAQPLRVAAGGIDLSLPTGWSYATQAVDAWTTQRLNLAPTGREIDAEARYARPLGGGEVAANLFWRRDPGNRRDLPADAGLALRYAAAF